MSAEPSGADDDARPAPAAPPRSPTIRSISDSKVTSPAVPPYSSMTMRLADAAPAHRGQQIVGASVSDRQRLARERAGVDVRVARRERLDARRSTCRMPTTLSRSSR